MLLAAAALVALTFVPQRPLAPFPGPAAAQEVASAAASSSGSGSPRPYHFSSTSPAASSGRPPLDGSQSPRQGVRFDLTYASALATFVPAQLGLGLGRVLCESLTFAVAASASLPRAHLYGVSRALGALAFAALSPLYGLLLDSDPFGSGRRASNATATATVAAAGSRDNANTSSVPPNTRKPQVTLATAAHTSDMQMLTSNRSSSGASSARSRVTNAQYSYSSSYENPVVRLEYANRSANTPSPTSSSSTQSRDRSARDPHAIQPEEQRERQTESPRRRRPYQRERFLIVAVCAAMGFAVSVGLLFLYRFTPRPSRESVLHDVWRVVRRPRIAFQLGVVLVTGFLFGSQDSLLYFWYIQVRRASTLRHHSTPADHLEFKMLRP